MESRLVVQHTGKDGTAFRVVELPEIELEVEIQYKRKKNKNFLNFSLQPNRAFYRHPATRGFRPIASRHLALVGAALSARVTLIGTARVGGMSRSSATWPEPRGPANRR